MIKKVSLAAALLAFSSLSFSACPNALPTDNPNFCASFKTSAQCYCTNSGLPAGMCQDLNQLYSRMTAFYGSLENACRAQKYTSFEDCMDNWNCYLFGGVDSHQRACSSNFSKCS